MPQLDCGALARGQVTFWQKDLDQSTQAMILAMLSALTKLGDINASVSLGSVYPHHPQQLIIPRRTWCWLWLESPENTVLSMKWHTRDASVPYITLHDWLEDTWPSGIGVGHPDYAVASLPWQDAANWQDFFRQRLKQRASSLDAEAMNHHAEAERLKGLADRLKAL